MPVLADNDNNENYYFKRQEYINPTCLHICAFNYPVDGSLVRGALCYLNHILTTRTRKDCN